MEKLPPECVSIIAELLDPYTLWSLSCTSRRLRFLAEDDHALEAILEHYAPYSTEVKDARQSGRWAHAFRRMVKTEEALTTASPYSAAFVALANDYIYCNGVLCYIHPADKSLRLFNLHQSATEEIVIDVHKFLDSDSNFSPSDTYKFRPKHYANNVLSCMYTPPNFAGRSRLFVIDVDQRTCLTNRVLSSRNKIFVRNTSKYLICGTHSEMGDDGFKRWRLEHFDMTNRKWTSGSIVPSDVVGIDVGLTVSFEIIDDYFYAVSSSTPADYDFARMSYYYGLRFPVSSPISRNIQMMSKKAMRRRDYREGPIDDRWSTLGLEKCHQTGNVEIVECLKEISNGEGRSSRTAYRTEVKLCDARSVDDGSDSEEDDNGPWYSQDSISTTEEPNLGRDLSAVHRVYDDPTQPTVTFMNCFMRSWNRDCETFIDLINSSDAAEALETRPLVRFIRRRRAANSGTSDPHGTTRMAQQHNTVFCWPPQDRNLPELAAILNPGRPNVRGKVAGVADDRSILYAIDDHSVRRLVFISFDPSIKLPGLTHWPGGPIRPRVASNAQTLSTTPGHIAGPPITSTGGHNTHQRPVQAVGSEPGPREQKLPSWFHTAGAMSWRQSPEIKDPIGFDMAY